MLLLIALFSSANAYDLLVTEAGDSMTWRSFPVPYTVMTNQAPEDLDPVGCEAAVAAAFGAWEALPATEVMFELDAAATDSVADSAHDGMNVVWFDHSWDADPDVVALTSTWATDEGLILGFDIRINADTVYWSLDGSDGIDLQNALAHEVGHALGFDHSDVPGATMYEESHKGELRKRDLHWDDEDGLRELYGQSSVPGFGCSVTSGSPSGALLLALLPLVARRRNTQKLR
jgi:hypothetical protein